jgi:DNA-binding MarR family transcriptional regulator
VRGCPDDRRVSISSLAQQLFIRHNSAVGLVDRLVQEKLIVRVPSSVDRRKVELRLTGRGRRVLAKLAGMHRRELQSIGPKLQQFFAAVPTLDRPGGSRAAVGRRKRTRPEISEKR